MAGNPVTLCGRGCEGGVTWARRFATGLSSLRDRAAARLASSSVNPSRCDEPDYVKDARRNPQNYFTCTGCGSGPWHKSWARIELGLLAEKMEYAMPDNPLGGCCSGAD
jgi:hypothetical protein